MLRNYTTETTLQTYVPHLSNLQWTSQGTYDAQIAQADIEVRNDLFNRGLRSVYLRPDLTFNASTSALTSSETTDSIQDELSRNRWVINCTAISGGDKTITLEGSNDGDIFETVDTYTITETGEVCVLISKNYHFYRTNTAVSAGSLTIESYLTETNYDMLFDYKTLQIILRPLIKSEGDQFDIAYREFVRLYNDLLNMMKVQYDSDNDGELDTGELSKQNIVRYYK